MRLLKKMDGETHLSPQKILFHRATNDQSIVALLMAGRYAITLPMHKVTNKLINKKVMDVFLRTQLFQLCDTYLHLYSDTSTWAEIKTHISFVINSEGN
jgi:hypothetical protein